MRPLNLTAMSDLRFGVLSKNIKCCTFRGFRNSALHEILQGEETTVKEMDNGKATPRDNTLLKISNGAPIQGGCLTDVNTTETNNSRCGLTMV